MITKIGEHRVRHGDVYDDLGELFDRKVDLFYSDPPWGEGNLKYWQTMNQKMNGVEPKEVNLDKFLNRIIQVAVENTTDDAIIFIEYGMRWYQQLVELAESYGLRNLKNIELLYGSPERPLMLCIFSKGKDVEFPEGYDESVWHTKGFDSLKAAVLPLAGNRKTICDPCCGLGYTAKLAKENGLVFYGNELNEKRLQKTMERLK